MRQTIHLLKALNDETRLRILALLGQGELCVCDLMTVLQMPQSTVSRHLAVLKNADWVTDRRQGLWMYYSMTDDGIPLLDDLRRLMMTHLVDLAAIQQDRERLGLYMMKEKQNACG